MICDMVIAERDITELLLELGRRSKRAPIAAVAASDGVTLFLPDGDSVRVYAVKTGSFETGHGILNALSGVEGCQLISEIALTLGVCSGAIPSTVPVAVGDAVVFRFEKCPIEVYVLFPKQYGFTPKQVVHFWEVAI